MPICTVNLNDLIRFKLSKRGKEILDTHILEMYKELGKQFALVDLVESDVQKGKDGYYEAQFWKFIEIFGKAFSMTEDSPVEKNEIEILSVKDIMQGVVK
jgi:translation initiation factor 2 alpha subunit (eIF-2alpha)